MKSHLIDKIKNFLKKILVSVLWFLAILVLKKYKPKIIAVTGSVGKTSTKDAVYSVISRFVKTRKSPKSFNSEIGVPLTILNCPNGWSNIITWFNNFLTGLSLIFFNHNYPEWLVLEVGAGKPGDIDFISKRIKTDIVIFTRFAKVPVHVEFFHSREHLLHEKKKLLKSLKDDGIVIVNNDDQDFCSIEPLKQNQIKKTFGFNNSSDIKISNSNVSYDENKIPNGMSFDVDLGNLNRKVFVGGVLGDSNCYTSTIAILVSSLLGFDFNQSVDALSHHELSPGRMRILDGVKDTIVIDDTYNSSPLALEQAINVVSGVAVKGRKIAVLGDMLELGRFTEESHIHIGGLSASSFDILVTVGKRARNIATGALNFGMNEQNIFQYEKSSDAGKFVEQIIQKGDLVLVKGSQGMRMENVVLEIMKNPEMSDLLLVRQDKEWKNK